MKMGVSQRRGSSSVGVVVVLVVVLAAVVRPTLTADTTTSSSSLEKECADNFQKLTTCLGYVTGKATTPMKDCCTAVSSIKDSKPVCLCYIIQQIHGGVNPQFKSLGIQEAKLLDLPSSCNLANASSSYCPKLLNLPANSPDAAIFADPSPSTATPAAAKGTTTSPSAPVTTANASSSNAIQRHLPQLAGIFLPIFAFFFFYNCNGDLINI